MWIPKNKKTGQEYPPITDEEKKSYLDDPNLVGKYTFIPVKETKPPKEAKKITDITSKALKK